MPAQPAPADSQTCRWHGVADLSALHRAVAARVLAAERRALRERGRFVVVLAGGNTPRGAYELLRQAPASWPAWQVYFGDERCAPIGDPERNSRMARSAWLDHVAIPSANVHEIPTELGPSEAARRYAAALDEIGRFDLVLLGLGEDGHTASLFPGHDLGRGPESASAMPVFDAPKAPPERVTMSARRLSATAEAVFMAFGAEKRAAVDSWRAGAPVPASFIVPETGVDVFVGADLLR
ncbi:MAG: 6-phosphogluconolactonase [Pseudomonadota bacterium]|nr:6-phosphogluconolactonase [Pseudomonadota bacterium]